MKTALILSFDGRIFCLCYFQVNALDNLGQTSLHRAAYCGHLQTCRLLLSSGCDPSIVSLQGFTALQMGTESVQQLLQGTAALFRIHFLSNVVLHFTCRFKCCQEIIVNTKKYFCKRQYWVVEFLLHNHIHREGACSGVVNNIIYSLVFSYIDCQRSSEYFMVQPPGVILEKSQCREGGIL